MIGLQRMFFLVEIHRLRDLRQGVQDGEVSMDAVSKELQEFYTEGRPSTFNSLCEMQSFASAIALQQHGVPRIFWRDDRYEEFDYNGNRMSRSGWAAMLHSLQDRIRERLRELVFGREDLLVDLGALDGDNELSDDPSNDTFGYSVFTDVRNHHIFPPLGRDRLLAAVASDDELSGRFFRRDGEGPWRFLVTACREWLSRYATFSKLCLAFIVLCGSGPSRSTELTAMNYANGRDGALRNFMMFGRWTCLIKSYHKMASKTGLLMCVPVALDAWTANVTIQNLAVLRPFAVHLANALYPGDLDVLDLYRTKLFVCRDRLFRVDDISNAMAEVSTEHLGVQVKVSDNRHLHIAFSDKWLGVHEEEEEEGDTIEAQMAGHSLRVERQHYARTLNVHPNASDDVFWEMMRSTPRLHVVFGLVPGKRWLGCLTLEALSTSPVAGNLLTLAKAHHSQFNEDWRRQVPLDASLSRYVKVAMAAVDPLVRERSAALEATLSTWKLKVLDEVKDLLTAVRQGNLGLSERLHTFETGECFCGPYRCLGAVADVLCRFQSCSVA